MKRYIVHQKYYDNGKVEAWIEICHLACSKAFEEHKNYDYYRDVFDNKSDARIYLKECRNT